MGIRYNVCCVFTACDSFNCGVAMSRIIAFREWDTGAKCWASGVMPVLTGLSLELKPAYRGIIIEQYTGLKDKNGNEIYEGDILQIDDFILGDFEVLWNNLGWAIKRTVGYETLAVHKSEDIVVVGNIHENPELLEK